MSSTKTLSIVGVIVLISSVAAHGTVTGIVADGVYYRGYNANFQYMQTQPIVVGWSTPEDQDNGFIAPSAYGTADMICHKGAANAQTSAKVAAGSTVELQWTTWPESHHGPVIDYLANCNGDCFTVDKTGLEFFKIDGVGLRDDTTIPGNWASDTLIANNNSWTVTIPSDIAPGNYVLRHEIIALHSAGNADGAQSYPQCVNLEITGSGTSKPAGILGTALYTPTHPGILVNIYQTLTSYLVPGPTMYSGAVIVSQTGAASTLASTSTTSHEASSSVAGVVTSSNLVSVSIASTAALTTTTSAVIPISPVSTPTSSSSFTRFRNSTCLSSRTIQKSTRRTQKPATRTKLPVAVVTSTVVPIAETSASVNTLDFPVLTPTFTPDVTIPTAVPTSSPTTIPASTLPAGTTLNDVLSWLASFFNKYGKTSYSGATVSRRHARDIESTQV